tara:strand:- start:607 stop:819 length:213 start_codon:yes stop_codon:yes gene_type:complete
MLGISSTQWIYTGVGTVGIYLAHWIENKIQHPEKDFLYNIDHVNRVAFYWFLGATGYWVAINQANFVPKF